MRLGEAVEAVSKFYPVGAVAFYNKQKPDPWEAECLKMESEITEAIKNGDTEAEIRVCVTWVKELKNLANEFKKRNIMPDKMDDRDAFYLADDERVRRWHSVKDKECYGCQTKQKVKIKYSKRAPDEPVIICEACMLGDY